MCSRTTNRWHIRNALTNPKNIIIVLEFETNIQTGDATMARNYSLACKADTPKLDFSVYRPLLCIFKHDARRVDIDVSNGPVLILMWYICQRRITLNELTCVDAQLVAFGSLVRTVEFFASPRCFELNKHDARSSDIDVSKGPMLILMWFTFRKTYFQL